MNTETPERVLVVIDPTKDNHPALDRAIITSRIRSLHPYIHVFMGVDGDSIDTSATNPALYRDADWFLNLLKPLRDEGLKYSSQASWSTQWQQSILEAAAQIEADLIVIADYSIKASAGFLSDSNWALLRKSQCPVLIVRPEAQPQRETVLAASIPDFECVLSAIDRYGPALEAIGKDPPPQPRWSQGWFPRLDAAAAYALIREHRPRRIVEVGSGHSTRFLARAVADGGLDTAILAIDPQPRADIAKLRVTTLRADVRSVESTVFDRLGPGDMLFIDSSHIAMPGTDVDHLVSTVLPALPDGVLVHVHDVFLPDDYPADWRWRGYNEQLLVAALLASGVWRPVFASHFTATRLAPRLASGVIGRLPLWPGVPETSLWLIRKSEPARIGGKAALTKA